MVSVLQSSPEYVRFRHEVADAALAEWCTPHLGYPDIQDQILNDCMWRADPELMVREVARSQSFVAEVLASDDRLKPYVQETPLVYSDRLSTLTGQSVRLKLENTQAPAPSFKVRTAANFMTKLSPAQRAQGGVASSTGNYAQGVAYMADALKMPVTIFMPESTTKEKIEATKRLGGDVQLVGTTFDEAKQASLEFAAENGAVVLPPYDHADAIAGNATAALEAVRRNPDAEYYFVPVGGGGLLAGVSKFIKLVRPDAFVYGVQEDTANAMTLSLASDQLVERQSVSGVADALLVKRAGQLTLDICREYSDGMINVSAPEIVTAHQDLQAELDSNVEMTGAVAVAGMLKFFDEHRHINREAVAFISGGSVALPNAA